MDADHVNVALNLIFYICDAFIICFFKHQVITYVIKKFISTCFTFNIGMRVFKLLAFLFVNNGNIKRNLKEELAFPCHCLLNRLFDKNLSNGGCSRLVE